MIKRLLLLIHLAILLVLWTLALLTDGTGGGGDSLTHFFFSQLSWQEPENFFNHWGKPFFTILSSPWAQFGFVGIKLFNILCGVAASYLASLVAIRFSKSWSWAVPIIAFITPGYYTFLFSGLTEPISALTVIGAIYLCVSGRVGWGLFLASFLPFCRSEAQIFLLFFLIFAVLNGHWKKAPLLLSGYIIMGFAGSFYHDSFWWIFNNPYNPNGSVYGKGEWFHYIDQLAHIVGGPFIILLALGLIQFFRKVFILQNFDWKSELWLVHGIFFSLLFGHSLVWALGIWGSAGLSRTMLTVFPLLWLISLDGLILLKDLSSALFKKRAFVLPGILIFIQTYGVATSSVSKYYYFTHLTLSEEDRFIEREIGSYISKEYPEVHHFVIDKPYLAIALDINFIDPRKRSNWSGYQFLDNIPDEALFIFDEQYVPVQYGLQLDQVKSEDKLVMLKEWESPEGRTYTLFKKAQS